MDFKPQERWSEAKIAACHKCWLRGFVLLQADSCVVFLSVALVVHYPLKSGDFAGSDCSPILTHLLFLCVCLYCMYVCSFFFFYLCALCVCRRESDEQSRV